MRSPVRQPGTAAPLPGRQHEFQRSLDHGTFTAGQFKDRAVARPRSGAGGVLKLTRRVSDDMAAGNGGRVVRVFGCVRSSHVPGHPVRAVPWLRSALGVSPAVAGDVGRVRIRRSGGANGTLPLLEAPF